MKHTMTRAMLIAATASVLSAPAAAKELSYTMAVISDRAHGAKVVAGDYDEAIDLVAGKQRRGLAAFEASTNLCVAYTKSRQIEHATDACDSAVKEARKRLANVRRSTSYLNSGDIKHVRNLALALSNRGVLHATQGETELARAAFAEAIELKTGVDTAKINLARLENGR